MTPAAPLACLRWVALRTDQADSSGRRVRRKNTVLLILSNFPGSFLHFLMSSESHRPRDHHLVAKAPSTHGPPPMQTGTYGSQWELAPLGGVAAPQCKTSIC